MKPPPTRKSKSKPLPRKKEKAKEFRKPVDPHRDEEILICDHEAEKWVVSYLVHGRDHSGVSALKESDFVDDLCREFFRELLKMLAKGMEEKDRLAEIYRMAAKRESSGGMSFLDDRAHWSEIKRGTVAYYVRKLKHMSNMRRMLACWYSVRSVLTDAPDDAMDRFRKIVEKFQDEIEEIQEGKGLVDIVMSSIDDIAGRAEGVESSFIPTTFQWIDEFIQIERGDNVVLSAGTGVGKSAFATNIAVGNCREGRSVCFVSLEMTENEVMNRILSIVSGVDHGDMRTGNIGPEQRAAIGEAANEISGWRMTIVNPGRCGVTELGAICERHRDQNGLDLIVVDYLGLLDPEDTREPRNEQIEKLSRGIKKLAVRMDAPVLNIHQLNREASKKGERPQLHHLKSSGAVEQDANMVIFLHSEDKTAEEPEVEVIVAKNRSGPEMVMTSRFQKSVQRFVRTTSV